ncbi:MAG: acyl-CoA thioesterase, partial [Sciscionella sp.]
MAVRSEQSVLLNLVALLKLERTGPDRFRGGAAGNPDGRLFGGHVAAQALAAAARTVDLDRTVHSLHAYFLAPGDTTGELTYTVERLRDGRSTSARRVSASQRGTMLFTLSAAFATPRAGQPEHQIEPPSAPDPEALPTLAERMRRNVQVRSSARLPAWLSGPSAFDVRYVSRSATPSGYDQCVWVRADGKLPDDPALHAGLLTYVSDLSLLSAVLAARGERWDPGRKRLTSLDHALWCHRECRVDEWLLYAQQSPASAGG